MSAPALELRDVVVRYGELVALEIDGLTIGAGRICALIGMNGAGKSTLFTTAIGMRRPDRGTVRLAGLDPRVARRSGLVAYVPQSEAIDLDFPISVEEVVMMGRYGRQGLTRRASRADRAAVAEALDRVELGELAQRQLGRLSGGQRKRAFLARALAQDASLLLLDEPFSGVDRPSEATISALLRELAEQGRTVVLATHDLSTLPGLADEAILLMRRVLLHSDTATVLQPENLARAFGLGEGRGDDAA